MPSDARRRPEANQRHLKIDHRPISAPVGTTVLEAAELAGVYVPSLCSHRELTPFGGCRLCTVEIGGMRGYPLACSTLVEEGMEVTTDNATLREMRREILQLMLSEHPSSCLLCGDDVECRRSQATIRKAGVSTGCRSCPKDGECELQSVVERIGGCDVVYPIKYRGLEVEHDDPFFDRDYNLCILCGRCVRMCQEVRGAAVLSFKHRGPTTGIGPAFGSSHVEAGCEFCGACVSVCPTGALADKVSKWDGMPDGSEPSTCPFCCLGCQVEFAHRNGALSSVRGAHDPAINDGQLCVRGRFCAPETTHHPERVRKPMLRHGPYFRVASWDETLSAVAERLRDSHPDAVIVLVSADLANEGLYAAQRLMRAGLGVQRIDSTGRACLSGGPALWSRLFSLPISLEDLGTAGTVIVAGLDSRFSFSVAGVQVRRAVRRGATLVTVDARESNLAQAADHWLRPPPGEEARALSCLVRSLGGGEPTSPLPSGIGKRQLAAAAQHVEPAGTLAVVIGPRVFDCPGTDALVADLETLSGREGMTVLPLAQGANIRGVLELGVLGEVPPGSRPAADGGLDLAQLTTGRRPNVLYLVGEAPVASRPDCDFLIAQDLYLPPFEVDAFLPAASFVEAGGTLTNVEGRVQEMRPVEHPPADAVHGYPLPDWRIFSDLAGRLGRPDLQYADARAVRAAIREQVPSFPAEGDRSRRRMVPLVGDSEGSVGARSKASGASPARAARSAAAEASAGTAAGRIEATIPGRGRFVLVTEQASFRHRGFDLAGVVEGLGELHLEQGLRMSPDDMTRLGVGPGGAVTVSLDGTNLVFAARPDPDCPRGAVYATRVEAWGGPAGSAGRPAPETPSHLPAKPVRVRVSAGHRSRRRRRGGDHGPGR